MMNWLCMFWTASPFNLKEISATIRTRDSHMSFEELYKNLLQHDSLMTQHQSFAPDALITTHVTSRHSGFHTGPNQHYTKNRDKILNFMGPSGHPLILHGSCDLVLYPTIKDGVCCDSFMPTVHTAILHGWLIQGLLIMSLLIFRI